MTGARYHAKRRERERDAQIRAMAGRVSGVPVIAVHATSRVRVSRGAVTYWPRPGVAVLLRGRAWPEFSQRNPPWWISRSVRCSPDGSAWPRA